MKKLERNLMRILIGIFCGISLPFNATGQSITISGDQSVFVGEQRVYNLSAAGANLSEITWSVNSGNGTVISTSTNNYQATIRFDVAGPATIYASARNLSAPYTSYITGNLSVTVAGPETPDNPTIKSNSCGTAVIRSNFNGGAPSGYRWYWQGKSSTSKSTSLGYSNEFTLNNGSGTYYLRARHTASGAWSENPSSVTVTIKEFTNGGSIEVQGSNNVICYNGTPPFLVNDVLAQGTSNPGTSYIWQYANSSSGPWVDTNGTSRWSYIPPTGLTTDRWYRRKVTSCGGQVKYSNVLMVDVRPQLAPGGISGAQTICYSGNPGTIGSTATASNGEGGYIYQWQVSANNSSWSNVSGATSTSYNPPGNMVSSRWYRRRVISCGQTKYTNKVKITVRSALTSGSTSGNQNICYGGNPSQISSTANPINGNTYSYQWQVSTNNSSWSNISGATAKSYTPPSNATSDRWYRRRVISCGQTKYTTAVLMDVGPVLTAGSIGGAQTICSGENAGNLASSSLASGGNNSYTYQWQISSNNGSWSDVSGATGTSYDPTTNLTSNRWYRRKVSSCGQVAYTASKKITVIGALAAPTGASTVEGCEYGNLNVSLVPASGGNTIRWYTAPTGGTHIDQGTLALTEVAIGSIYYGSTYAYAGCESSTRKQVTITAAPANSCGAPDSGNQDTFISGDTNMFVGEERTYTMTPPVGLEDIVWTVPSNKGTILSYSANKYSVTIKYDAPGEYTIGVSGKESNAVTNYITSSLKVFVVGPQAPPTPLIAQNACGELVLKHNGTPETGFRWYWQGKSSTNKNTSQGYATEFHANSGTGTYYLRNYHVASQSWSASPSSRNVTAINQFAGGSIAFYSNSSNQICYNGDPPDLVNSDLPPGRITTETSYSWEYADSANGPWSPAGEANGFYYDPPSGLTADRWYRRKVTSCSGEVRYSNVLGVEVTGGTQAPQGAGSYGICPGGTLDIDLTVGNGNVVRWYINQTTTNHLEEGILTLNGASIGSSFYASSYNTTSGCESDRVLVTITVEPLANCTNNGPDLGTDPDINLTISGDNYVYTRAYQTGQATAPNFFTPNDDLIQQITYFDGVGRGIQQIGMDHSPQKQDIVTHMEYDGYGRVVKEYLPYASSQGTPGSLKTGNLAHINTWYDVSKYENTQNPFSEKGFEQSPLNRVYKQAAPGNDWAMGQGNEIEFGYETNTAADNVRQFEVSLAVSGDTYVPTLVENSTNLAYGDGELYKSVTKDENHTSGNDHTSEAFTNKQGQVVLKRTYESDQPHDTYYVYDDHGNLSFVLPPLMEATTTAIGTLISNMPELGYQYVYDHRNRLVAKQIPGKEKEYIIYNRADQPIMTQDANQRTSGEWLFTKYDAFGRVAYTGKATSTVGTTRTAVQDEVDGLTGNLWAARSAQTTFGGADISYNDGAYPTTTTTQAQLTEILTINYYDDYDFDRANEPGPPAGVFGEPMDSRTKGLATGSKIKVLDVSPARWITTVTRYDDKARPIYTYSENAYLGTVDRVGTKLDFVGRALKVRSSHSRNNATIVTLDNFAYDHVGRLLRQTQCIGDATLGESCNSATTDTSLVFSTQVTGSRTDIAASSIILRPGFHVVAAPGLSYTAKIDTQFAHELIVYNDYDELGQLVRKKVGGTSGTTFATTTGNLQTVDYAYNIRGWLKQINDPASIGTDLFAFSIAYNSPSHGATALYNGNITETEWRTANTDNSLRWYKYEFDALNRIESATDNTGMYSLSGVSYDKMGNIQTLQREGWTNNSPSLVNNTGLGLMDDMIYTYNGNQLQAVDEATNASATFGFVDGTELTTEYTYDANGNMVRDLNKGIGTTGIDGITYNHLNLPVEVKFDNDDLKKITYIYDDSGIKLQKTVTDGSSVTTTDYAGNYIYENGTLQFFNQPEGYITPNWNGGYDYVYQYKDHLGNVRLSYTDADNNGSIDASNEITKETNYYPFGLSHKGYNGNVSPLGNSVAQRFKFGGKEYDESLELETYDFGSRNYMPDIGRWGNMDPLAEFMRNQSPFNFGFNNPIYFSDFAGTIPWPVPEMFRNWYRRLGSPFGPRTRNGRTRNHNGVDINFSGGYNTDYGAPILATHSGTVVRIHSTNEGAAGRYIEIESPDGSFMTRYLHLSSIAVEEGQEINEGQTIGLLGGSGFGYDKKIKGGKGTYWAHLHYEIHRNGSPINPVGSDGALIDPQRWIPQMGPFINAEAYNFGSSWGIFDIPFTTPDQGGQTSSSGSSSGSSSSGSSTTREPVSPVPVNQQPITPIPVTPPSGGGGTIPTPSPTPTPPPAPIPRPNCVDCGF
ncbi:DUF6443 domain-containing protein [Flagellimonas sp. HMM57]|uniref:DUF6443 domain-containing protein n=1 Tax=unclassified Flagellimonas TaxID=2644544 RepID=UPI0013D5B503|nr:MULTISPECIES: DUF6443 domain-containing protein [unclassified Flagellimonas]UII76265.1 DUF6443 domain-containing protein [Flagellimonas sp. HMM57]